MEALIRRTSRLFVGLLAIALVAGMAAEAPAQPRGKKGPMGAIESAKKGEKEVPLHITAARLEADQKAGFVQFSGNVKAQYGEYTMYAENLWVYFQPEPKAPGPREEATAKAGAEASPLADLGGEKITRIVARGQVRFVQEDRVASGQEAIYYKDKEEVVLLGNPQLWQGENTLKGERIVFNLKNNTMQVESSPQKRVEAHIYSTAKAAGGKSPGKGEKGKRQ
jgi:lipopolysaccharide export system protein LptA